MLGVPIVIWYESLSWQTMPRNRHRIGHLAPNLRRHGVRRLSLFGSFLRNAQHADSDVDLLIDFMPGSKTYDNFFAVGELLENALGGAWSCLPPNRSARTSVHEFCKRRKMSSSPIEYLRHMLAEANYIVASADFLLAKISCRTKH